jgi:hypothetical protein
MRSYLFRAALCALAVAVCLPSGALAVARGVWGEAFTNPG